MVRTICAEMFPRFRVHILTIAALCTLLTHISSSPAFKITRVECHMEDEAFGRFEYCRLKAVKRNVAEFSLKLILLQPPVKNVNVHFELLRKYNGYKPFIFNYSTDACAFIKNQKKWPAVSVVYNIFGRYTNLNHSCPYVGPVIIDKFYPQHKDLMLNLPTGDYLLNTNWSIERKLRIRVNVWFIFQELD